MSELKLELHSPITEEEWDLITDVDLDHTPSVMFHTKHGKDVEYVKVKHGRWKAWDLTWGRSIYVCTSCGDAMEVPTENGKPIFNYCPNCGADMREVEE